MIRANHAREPTAEAVAALIAEIRFVALAEAAATATADITTEIELQAALSGEATTSADLQTQIALVASLSATAAMAGSLGDVIPPVPLGYASRAGSRRLFGAEASANGVSGTVEAENRPGGAVTPINGVGGRIIT